MEKLVVGLLYSYNFVFLTDSNISCNIYMYVDSFGYILTPPTVLNTKTLSAKLECRTFTEKNSWWWIYITVRMNYK